MTISYHKRQKIKIQAVLHNVLQRIIGNEMIGAYNIIGKCDRKVGKGTEIPGEEEIELVSEPDRIRSEHQL